MANNRTEPNPNPSVTPQIQPYSLHHLPPSLPVMTVLDDLSAEIFLQIFSLLPCHDLAAACLVSRRWLELGEQRLYTEVSFAAASLENFVTTITSRPGIATHVRSLDVKCKFALSTDLGVGLAQLQQLLPSLATIAILPPYNRSLRDPFPGGAAPTF